MGVFTATFLFLVYLLNFGLFRLSSITWFIFMPIAATAVLLSAILLVVPIGSIDPRVRRILVFSAIFIAYVCVAAVVFHGVKYRDEAQKDGAILLAWAITAFHFLTHYRFWYRDTERFVAMDKWVRAFSYFYTIFYTLGLLLSLTLFGFQPD